MGHLTYFRRKRTGERVKEREDRERERENEGGREKKRDRECELEKERRSTVFFLKKGTNALRQNPTCSIVQKLK